jgi:hypothetical protein
MRELYRRYFRENTREARGFRLLRGWLSPCQARSLMPMATSMLLAASAEGNTASTTAPAMNVHELDGAGHLKMGWCFVPDGSLVASDVMRAQSRISGIRRA